MPTCDIFCKVIDNYGDAGIAWRLASGLADTYGYDVRLFIDDITPLTHLAPDYLKTKVDVVVLPLKGEDKTADLVIECLGATVPDAYIQAIAERTRTGTYTSKPLIIRYEYLTAEDWAADVHLKPSPPPTCPDVRRYFFWPRFKPGTGGLLFSNVGN